MFQIFANPKTHGNGVHNLKAFCLYKTVDKTVIHYESIEFHLRSIKGMIEHSYTGPCVLYCYTE